MPHVSELLEIHFAESPNRPTLITRRDHNPYHYLKPVKHPVLFKTAEEMARKCAQVNYASLSWMGCNETQSNIGI